MAGEWRETEVGKVFEVNPFRSIPRGQVTPFIPMDVLPEHGRSPTRIEEREFTGSGVKFKNGDTLIARITPCLENGKTAFINDLPDGAIAHGSTEYIVLSGKPNQTDNLFAYYLARSPDFRRYAIGHMEGTSGRQRVPSVVVEKYVLALPPFNEQRAIAHILGTLDDKIELNRRMSETLEDMARALFKSWFVDFDPVRAKAERRDPGLPKPLADLFPDSFEDSDLGDIPNGWEVGRIKDCCSQIQNGGTPRRGESRFWDGGNIAWLTSGEVRQPVITSTENFITEAGLAESSAKWVSPFATVIALYGATAGQVSLVSTRLTTNQAVCTLIPKKDCSFFNYLWMRTMTTELESKAVGSAQQNISKGIVEETRVVLPPSDVLYKFATLVGPIFNRWISNLHQSRTLASLRDTLLPKLVSGEIRANLVIDNVEAQA